MKKIILVLVSAFLLVNDMMGQAEMSKEAKLKDHILSLDIAAWDAWKNRDIAYFKANTTETFQSCGAEGISTKAEMITTSFVDCNVRSFSLDNVGFIRLNKKAVMLTYTATQDAECGGQKLSPKVIASVTYVKEGGKWLEAFYIEAAMNE